MVRRRVARFCSALNRELEVLLELDEVVKFELELSFRMGAEPVDTLDVEPVVELTLLESLTLVVVFEIGLTLERKFSRLTEATRSSRG
ncbi:hypothetical protein Y695_04603 [Hydrogenophaga sp. T4]|nr:hypothetical protein Y695_04603 [Hydrogenophaga sp. T4]